jgi:hypothetical protein
MLTADSLTTTMLEMTSISSKRFHKEKEKVHDGAKEVHRKCLQENKMGQ